MRNPNALIQKLDIPIIWDVPADQPVNARKPHFLSATGMLLGKLPIQNVAPLKKSGIRLFSGDRSIGGYYRPNSSRVHVNVAVHPTMFPISLLHEIGHLVHFEILAKSTREKFTRISWLSIGPFRLRKFWMGCSGFFTPYSASSPEEDFAEHYAGAAAADFFSREEWLEIGFGKPLACPVCGVQSFSLDPKNGTQGLCGACDTLCGFVEGRWIIKERNVVAKRARARGLTWPPPK
jgi:hypothetical protein